MPIEVEGLGSLICWPPSICIIVMLESRRNNLNPERNLRSRGLEQSNYEREHGPDLPHVDNAESISLLSINPKPWSFNLFTFNRMRWHSHRAVELSQAIYEE